MNPLKDAVGVALLGPGVVGSNVARLISEQSDDLAARIGMPLKLRGVGSRRDHVDGIDSSLLTPDMDELVRRGDVDVVVETLGGIEPARTLILAAIEEGKSVVTANKALLARHGDELFAAAEANDVDLYYEAAVGGAIPIIRPLRESLVADKVNAVLGIVNGTTNYILDQMHTTGVSFDDALADAQRLGYAEADPTADIEGYDAAAKAALLASLAFHTRVVLNQVDVEGITAITSDDIAAANELGCVIKLLADCQETPDGTIGVGVHPTMVPRTHPLASVGAAFNAISVKLEWADSLMFLGPGAGGAPTASAVMGDVVSAARNRVRGVAGPGESSYREVAIADPGELVSRFYLALSLDDTPGVLAAAATVFANHGVSIQTMTQMQDHGRARLHITTHAARYADVRAVVAELESNESIERGIKVLRVLGA